MMNSVCVYCGASINNDVVLRQAISDLADNLTKKNIILIYGGGSVGVMGILADAVLANNGEVIGVIPQFLMDKEVGHLGVTEMFITQNMHERKQKMADLAEGFMILPGGFGTLEEFFEVLTWLQLGLHQKPIGILNVNGYYNHLLLQIDVMVEQGFLKPENRALILSDEDSEKLIQKMNSFSVKTDDNWFKERNLS
jgi:uncharacterized protein (TIGR00730 family)